LPAPDFIDDGTVAIMVAMLLFLIPARSEKARRLMNWRTASKLHWGIVLLFGGGFALAAGFEESGLSIWIGDRLAGLSQFPAMGMVAGICGSLTFLTELTSNTATTQIVLPILGSLAGAIHVNPLLLMIPATISASCAFMLPVATPPNAIVFGSGEVTMESMIKAGIFLNLIGIVLITAYIFAVGTFSFGVDLGMFPDWATPR
jgi:sodium-dependent dicarboxylate transporter 2/3/5